MKTVATILTHEPKFRSALNSAKHLTGLDLVQVLIPESQESAFEAARRAALERGLELPRLEVLTHDVSRRRDGGVRYGELRWLQATHTQNALKPSDAGLLLDDDIRSFRFVDAKKRRLFMEQKPERDAAARREHRCEFKALSLGEKRALCSANGLIRSDEYATRMQPNLFANRMRTLADKARGSGIGYFTFGCNTLPYCHGLNDGGYGLTDKWSGVLGLFKDSNNPFDRSIGQCEDWDAAGRIIKTHGGWNVLRDQQAVIEMAIDRSKYRNGGRDHAERVKNMRSICEDYQIDGQPVFKIQETTRMGQIEGQTIPALRGNRAIIGESRV